MAVTKQVSLVGVSLRVMSELLWPLTDAAKLAGVGYWIHTTEGLYERADVWAENEGAVDAFCDFLKEVSRAAEDQVRKMVEAYKHRVSEYYWFENHHLLGQRIEAEVARISASPSAMRGADGFRSLDFDGAVCDLEGAVRHSFARYARFHHRYDIEVLERKRGLSTLTGDWRRLRTIPLHFWG